MPLRLPAINSKHNFAVVYNNNIIISLGLIFVKAEPAVQIKCSAFIHFNFTTGSIGIIPHTVNSSVNIAGVYLSIFIIGRTV